jgi:methyl-accepting chemotaxis protein-1 (serine sensor receptor)
MDTERNVGLKNITIKNKLIAGFGLMAVLVLVIAGMSLRALSTATDGFSHYVNGINARADVADQLRAAVDRRAIVKTPADIEIEKADVLRAYEDVQAKLKQLKDMIAAATDTSEKALSLVAEMDRVEGLYGPVATNIVGLALAGDREQAIAKMDDECRPLLGALVKATDAYASYTRERREVIVNEYQSAYEARLDLLLGLSAFAVLLAVAAGVSITRSVTRPIGFAVDIARTVARGDLRSTIVVDSKDEVGELMRALREMNDRLTETVGRVRESSGAIGGAAKEIATGTPISASAPRSRPLRSRKPPQAWKNSRRP